MRFALRRPLLLLLSIISVLALAGPSAGAAQTSTTCEADCLRVYSITMYDWLGPDAEAHVKVVDELGGAIRGALVHGVWTLPDGTTLDQYDVIGTRLRAEFPLNTDQSGTVTFTVAEITLAGYTFDPDGSALLSASIDVGDPTQTGCVVDCVSVAGIRMLERRGEVSAIVSVVDENGAVVAGAGVDATWVLPDGTEVVQSLTANRRSRVRFDILVADPGLYTITIDQVAATGLTFDPDAGVATASYIVN